MKAKTLSALADTNRLRIIELLQKRPHSVNEIALKLKLRQPQVSKHLQTLSHAGLVTVQPVAQRRVYGLAAQPFAELEAWLRRFERHANQQLDQLDKYLKEEGKK